MSMNEKLAEFYGTNQPSEADLEKLAAAELAESLNESGDASIDDLDVEELEALAREVLEDSSSDESEESEVSDEDESEKTASAEDEVDPEFAQADYMGRIMAHALHNEMRNIAEEEYEKTAGLKDSASKAGKWVADKARKAGSAVKDYHTGAAKNLRTGATGKSGGEGPKAPWKHRAKEMGKGMAKLSPHAAALGGAGYAAKKKMEKRSSATPAFDTLVEARIAQLQEEMSQSDGNPYETLESAVDAAARNALGIE